MTGVCIFVVLRFFAGISRSRFSSHDYTWPVVIQLGDLLCSRVIIAMFPHPTPYIQPIFEDRQHR